MPLTAGRPGLMFGHEGIGILTDPAPRLRTADEEGAAARLDRLADSLARARPDILLAIGPLTNLGALLGAGVKLPPLAIMGGKFSDVMLAGMVAHISEWNWFCDPVSVQRVVATKHASLPRVVPAEVTFRTALAEGDVERLAGGDALAQLLATLCEEWLRALRDRFGAKRPRIALHDPLTAATLVEPKLCRFQTRSVAVDDQGATTSRPGPANVEVAVDVDARALRDHLLRTWLGPGHA